MSLERFNIVARPFMQEETAEMQNVLARVYRGTVDVLTLAVVATEKGLKVSVVNTFNSDPTMLLNLGNLLVEQGKEQIRKSDSEHKADVDTGAADDLF